MKYSILVTLVSLYLVSVKGQSNRGQVTITQGTIMIIAVAKDSVTLAADSKFQTKSDLGQSDEYTKCKIFNLENFFFGSTGYSRIDLPSGTVDLTAIIQSHTEIVKQKTFVNKVSYVRSMMSAPINKLVAGVKNYFPKAFDTLLNREPFVNLIFAGFEDGKPQLTILQFGLKSNNNGSNEVYWQMGEITQVPSLYAYGKVTAFENFIKSYPHQSTLSINDINNIINQQSELTPETVGGQADIVVIDSQGHRWVQHPNK